MTVVGVGDLVLCKWFNRVNDFPQGLSLSNASPHKYGEHQIGKDTFPPDALELVKNNK